MVNQAFDDPDIEEVITNVDTKPKTTKVCTFHQHYTEYYTEYHTEYYSENYTM